MYAPVNQVSIGLDNGLLPIRSQDIIWTSAGLLSIGPSPGVSINYVSDIIRNETSFLECKSVE